MRIVRSYTALLPIALVILGVLVNIKPTQAAAVTGFNAGRIMDDAIFTKKSSMSATQIQNFLNAKMPNCDTNGTKTSEWGGGTRAQYGKAHGNPAPFICLKNYKENPTVTGNSANNWWKNGRTNLPGSTLKTSGAKTAAQIIYQAAQDYSINPQVLIVLLQKEQGLVTDDWPWIYQYRSATGYGCPDNAACATEYYGLYNQVRWAARMFRAILNQSDTWYTPYSLGNNRIYWNPSLGDYQNNSGNKVRYDSNNDGRITTADAYRSGCGYTTINIENLSTVALYSYTPYRPNQSALNAGYGTGNSCSSYGNRNFYQYFKDWFGSPFATYAASITSVKIYTDEDRTNELSGTPNLRSGEKIYLTIRAKNTGSKTWDGSITRVSTDDPRGRSSKFTDSSWLYSGRAARTTEASVAPGGTGTFEFSLTAPKVDGNYTEKFTTVEEGKQWMNDSPNFSININVRNPYNGAITSIKTYSDSNRTKPVSSRVKTGSTTYWRVTAKNTGENSCSSSIVKMGTASPHDRVSALSNGAWLSSNRAARLTESSVAKNASGTFEFEVMASTNEKSIVESFGLLAEGQSWMPNATFDIRVSTSTSLDRLSKNQTLYSGEYLYSSNGNKLIMQSNGDLVIYRPDWKAVWHTKTGGKGGNKLIMQSNGDLVIYRPDGKAVWHTKTGGKGGNKLIMQSNGDLVIYRPDWKAVWHTSTNGK